MRQRFVSDDDSEALDKRFDLADLRSIETKSVHVAKSCIHGDLHCGNVLVKSDGTAILIDFGDAGPGFTCLDPIALELSSFSPDALKLGLSNSLSHHLDRWLDLEQYAKGHKLRDTIIACRDWAHDVGGSDHSVLASAYSYVLRQLKYDTVDPTITRALLNDIVARIIATENH